MEVRAYAATDIGRVKKNNEDNFLIDHDLGLYLVADGMGGHAAGEVASQLAVEEVQRAVKASEVLIQHFINTGDGRDHILDLIESAIRTAGQKIYEMSEADAAKRGMGTTCSMILITPQRAFIAHVGDSRVYLIRGDEVLQLTEDHSLINEMIKRGRMTVEQAKRATQKNVITRAVGVYADVDVDTLDLEIHSEDRFLICSDGLINHMEDPKEIAEVMVRQPFPESAQVYVDIANQRGGKDNITVLLVEIPKAKAAERRIKISTIRKMPLFQHLSNPEQMAILNLCELRAVEEGGVVFNEGEVGEELFLILSGAVEMVHKDVRLAQFKAGAHFGEMAIMNKSARSATARATTETRLIVVGRRPLFALMRREPSLAVKILWTFVAVLSTRLKKTGERLCELQNAARDVQEAHKALSEEHQALQAQHEAVVAEFAEVKDLFNL
ncbi:Stp1/IreP family PP2C-type Ser/Thr phosphatase [Myxococcota bacterium]|nr:Stp1/IreP family PP2C-type Ser/Thr phosphatase [Myxococcota bacterium]MBU1431592.1 Stp1/IreP family PP2C-type Ser/Thr phosphatase [Myxococcota bacterium]MBU1900395.1 Stp1/IreP family PP2C-type Ser/Thr phosphatase [Myxococcota bacterium]